jgi:hypothetical protein
MGMYTQKKTPNISKNEIEYPDNSTAPALRFKALDVL